MHLQMETGCTTQSSWVCLTPLSAPKVRSAAATDQLWHRMSPVATMLPTLGCEECILWMAQLIRRAPREASHRASLRRQEPPPSAEFVERNIGPNACWRRRKNSEHVAVGLKHHLVQSAVCGMRRLVSGLDTYGHFEEPHVRSIHPVRRD